MASIGDRPCLCLSDFDHQLLNHAMHINQPLQPLDYLGTVAARLRKDTIDNDVLSTN